ncbi:glycosyltransferase [Cyanobium sp. Morenito 9A2]|uniref:glycosyltransferase n=1 Tax=Cyanobium sp. Morenito 9A2 TaxID=2823718 RepID=UPI0020CE5A7C|nr:glycosyltransferase [Cyanobium sp. Morenito 9A2]MCP9849779.1 glycosyltransferase [Cyanobium sp. Morenito 9A2]
MLSVVLPTHNPNPERLERTLEGLRVQTLATAEWEMLLVDNASDPELSAQWVSWHPRGRLVREQRLGLTHARLRGLAEAAPGVIAWVDDDNVLAPTYLEEVRDVCAAHPRLGAAGGPAIAEVQGSVPAWFVPDLAPIGCRDHGDQPLWMEWNPAAPAYPAAAPIGAGLAIRTEAMAVWAEQVKGDPRRLALGRSGQALSSGEDNDICLTLLRAGWQLAYLPQLRLTHLIPSKRLELDYQRRLAEASFRDFVRVLDLHGLRPWPAIPVWSVPLRSLRAWFRYRVWRSPERQVRWRGAVGQFRGRALLEPTEAR